MNLFNTENNYGAITKIFHWLMALMIIAMLAVGLIMTGMQMGPDKLRLYGLHKATGLVILFLFFLRLAWRQFNYQPPIPEAKNFKPGIFNSMEFAAKASHALLYFMLFMMPATGWLMTSAYGFPVSFFGLFTLPNLVAPDKALAEQLEWLHDTGAYVFIGLISAHIGAALFHHFILKDIVLKRMLPALVFIALALPAQAQEFEVDKAKSSIKFEAVQNGAPVTGEFKDYTAQINFSPDELVTSKAVVEIKLASVASSYDEMTENLKSKDWFDTAKFPTAKFEAEQFVPVNGETNNFIAMGKLTIRDKTHDVSLKFKLKEFDAKHAVIDGETMLSRTTFGIGWPDVATVKDAVKVTVHIEAFNSPLEGESNQHR